MWTWIKASFYIFLNLVTRSWAAFWLTWLIWIVYIYYNLVSSRPFDPFPFVLLMGIVTLISYQQNVIIMLMQRENDKVQEAQQNLQKKQLQYMLTIMETMRDALLAVDRANPTSSRVGVVEASSKTPSS